MSSRLSRNHRAISSATLAWGLLVLGTSCRMTAEPSRVIALLTDYGTHDFYAGVLEGSILRVNPAARISTITHEIEPFDIREGSYVLAQAAPAYPAGTVFVAIVDPGVGTARRPIVLRSADGTLFVGPDNGLFSEVLRRFEIVDAYEITSRDLCQPRSSTFHGRDIFGPVGAHLSRGVEPSMVGPAIDASKLVRLTSAVPTAHGDTLSGEIVHVDRYGNLITNIPRAMTTGLQPGERYHLMTRDSVAPVTVGQTYGDVPVGEFVVLVNAEGAVEIAANTASAAALRGVRAGDPVALAPDALPGRIATPN